MSAIFSSIASRARRSQCTGARDELLDHAAERVGAERVMRNFNHMSRLAASIPSMNPRAHHQPPYGATGSSYRVRSRRSSRSAG